MLKYARSLLGFIRKLRFRYVRLVEVRIRKSALIDNLNEFQKKYEPLRIAPVLKSNAYGHGLVEVGGIFDLKSIPFLCVDSYFEALILRKHGVRCPVLVLGYSPIENVLLASSGKVAFSIIDIEQLKELSASLKKPRKFHIEIDTGMHRHGISPDELDETFALIKGNGNIRLEGVFTHFADADAPNSKLNSSQIRKWNGVAEKVKKTFPNVRYVHCGGSSVGYYAGDLRANVLRVGKGIYGINMGLDDLNLKPVLSAHTRVVSIRKLSSGDKIGYNGTFVATENMRIASVPFGYAEGLDRRLSSKGIVFTNGQACPILGRISMNISSIDISGVPDVRIGDEVTVISSDPEAPNSVQKMAEACDTIPHEILIHIPPQLRRTVI